MPTEKDIIKALILQLMECEVEQRSLGAVLAIMMKEFPAFPALDVLRQFRQNPETRQYIEYRYRPLLEAMDTVDAVELLKNLPSTLPN
jgi:hypothetical protein